MHTKMNLFGLLVAILISNTLGDSLFKILGVSIGESQCPEGKGRVVIQSGHLRLVDTVLSDSAYLNLDKILPARELEISGFIVCEGSSLALDEVKISDSSQKRKIELGGKVSVDLDSVYVGERSAKRMSALDSELKFKKFLAGDRVKRLNLNKQR